MPTPLGGLPQLPFTDQGDPPRFTTSWAGWFSIVQNLLQSIGTSGTTVQRPTSALWVGRRYFDTSLGSGKPIWVQSLNPTVWCDATGAAV